MPAWETTLPPRPWLPLVIKLDRATDSTGRCNGKLRQSPTRRGDLILRKTTLTRLDGVYVFERTGLACAHHIGCITEGHTHRQPFLAKALR